MNDLLPCPFCGGEAETCHVTQLWEPRNSYWAKCKNCHISGTYHKTEAEAIAAWNTRIPNTPKNDDFFQCSECGSSSVTEFLRGGYGFPNYCPNCGAKVIA